jgi:hypothetical protein
MMVLWLTLACQSGSSSIYSPEEIQNLAENPERRQRVLAELSLEQRDLLLLQLAVYNPTMAPKLCAEVQGDIAKDKCNQVIGRPHLQLSKPQVVDGSKR